MNIPYIRLNTNFSIQNVKERISDCLDEKSFVNSKYVNELEKNGRGYTVAHHLSGHRFGI